ncbi:MAG: hypothetical protein ACT4PT_12060 [Methanobacteriota archaeon]
MSSLIVRCKQCRRNIRTGIATGFIGRPVLGDHVYRCPACGTTAHYHAADYVESPA